MQHSICVMLISCFIIVPVICLPLGSESTVTEQGHSSPVEEEELKIISVEHYEPLVALSKKKPSLPAEDPTTKVPSMLLSFSGSGKLTDACVNLDSENIRSANS